MKKFFKLFQDTVTGGLFFLIPMFVLIFLVNKIWAKITGAAKGLAALFGIQKAMDGGVGAIITIVIILLICFVSGMLLRVSLLSTLRNKLDAFLERKIPGYGFYKLTMEQKIKKDDAPSRPVVLLTIDGVSQPGAVIEQFADGRKVVFVSSHPASTNGNVYVVDTAAVTELPTTELDLNKILKSRGEGLVTLVEQNGVVKTTIK
jgi:uncharacterized membrane protein